MIRTSTARTTTGAGAGSAALEIIAGTRGFFLRWLDLSLVAATASIYQVGRPAAKGITPTAPVLFPMEGVSAAPGYDATTIQAATALAWATPPTVPASFYRGASLAAAVGSTAAWEFDGVWVPAGGSIVLWNVLANSVAVVNIVIDEVNS